MVLWEVANDLRLKFKVQFLQFRNNEKYLVKKLNISQSQYKQVFVLLVPFSIDSDFTVASEINFNIKSAWVLLWNTTTILIKTILHN